MALTMTRTRTQTTLTRLARLLANLNGELEFVSRLAPAVPEHQELCRARQRELELEREAVCITLSQFDRSIDVSSLGALNDCLRPFGRREKQRQSRYLAKLLLDGK